MFTFAKPTKRAAAGRTAWRVWLMLVCAWAWSGAPAMSVADAQDKSGQIKSGQDNPDQATQDGSAMKVSLGLAGVWKIGHVTPLKVELPRGMTPSPQTIEVQTFDGDGVAVSYRHPIQSADMSAQPTDASNHQVHWCMITIGRADRPVNVRVLGSDGQEIQTQVLTAERLGKPLPTLQPWIVALGNSLGVEATSYMQTESGLPNFTTTVLARAEDLPDHWRGLSACDVVIVATSPDADSDARPMVDALSPAQWSALDDWCQHGGTTIISVGKYVSDLPAEAPLVKLLPGPVVEQLTSIDSGTLESATATKIRLGTMSAVRFGTVRGKVELAMLDNRAQRFPWWIRYSRGKGVIHCVASDLDQAVIKRWPDRRLVWEKLLAGFWAREQRNDSASADRNTSGSSFLGYDDLVGQLRATLDYFPDARVFSFAAVTAILAGLLILIGPVDYWVSVRWLRRPSFSWGFTGVTLAISSVGLIWLHNLSRPKEILLNSAHIVDFLPAEKRFLVDSWTHMYSSRARTVDAQLTFPGAVESVRLDWQGLPGKGLGGMESNLLTDQNMPAYAIETGKAASSAESTSVIRGVGIPASGTKCLFATWSGPLEPQGQSQLTELKGIDQIQGRLVNPLPYEIHKPVLFYHNWAYNLPSRLRPGEEISITYQMIPKDLMRRLNRRQVVDSKEVITSWSPDDRESLDRLLEIMMFYKASGGVDYTKLKHRFQPRTDISSVMALDSAVLYGQLMEPPGKVGLGDQATDSVRYGTTSTWCRVLLPVARPEE